MLSHTLLLAGILLGLAQSSAAANILERAAASTCQAHTTIQNVPLDAPPPANNSAWEIDFYYGHHTTNTADACLGGYVAVTSQQVPPNTCTLIHTLNGGRLAAKAAIWMNGDTTAVKEVDFFYEFSTEESCSQGKNVFCNTPGKGGWTCVTNMYNVDNMVVVT